ncbi:DNA-binding response regulator [Bacteroidia bacterium]|nr:DNA-binding response regulator [Bacteroidia bacterium]
MIKILIADDESSIREGVKAILKRHIEDEIEWLEAEDGREALRLIEEKNPEIIITDLNMPFIHGLELISRSIAGESHGQPTFIILSGYDEFVYAREAIKLGVIEYLLKPVNTKELVMVVKNAIKHILEEKQSNMDRMKQEIFNREVVNEKHRTELMNALCGESAGQRIKAIDYLINGKILFRASVYQCIIVSIREVSVQRQNLLMQGKTLSDIFSDILHEFHMSFAVCELNERESAVIVGAEDNLSLSLVRERALTTISETINMNFKGEKFVAVGCVVADIVEIGRSFGTARLASAQKLIQGHGISFTWKDEQKSETLNSYILIEMPTLLKLANWEEAYVLIKREADKASGILHDIIRIYDSVNFCFECVRKDMLPRQSIDSLPHLGSFWSIEEMLGSIKENLRIICSAYKENNDGESGKVLVLKVLRYASKHYNEYINLNMIAEILGKNPSYVSTAFKAETGENFSKYITKLRIEHAKEMLRDEYKPVQEISVDSGFISAKHFNMVFKNMTKMTPSQYRKQILNIDKSIEGIK